ncbi:MAG: protein kinase [Pyrinomonadaceae bacterium]
MSGTPNMSPDRWKHIRSILEKAVEVGQSDLAEFLDSECGEDRELREEILSFLNISTLQNRKLEQDALSSMGTVAGPGAIPKTAGGFKLVEKIGEGGMGAVFLGEKETDGFKQTAAVKIVRGGLNTDAVIARFVTERRIVASLEHPNIARLLDGGTTEDGVPFFAMEYVSGKPLSEYCEGLAIEDKLGIFLKICDAISYAHRKLVVHRDLKPSNIIVTESGEPKLLDFGIGKILDADGLLEADGNTKTAMQMLTPEYASPEQIRGLLTTTSTDIYSLGVILYEVLCGRRPFRLADSTPFEFSQEVLLTDPPNPSKVAESGDAKGFDANSLKGDLDNIVLKALRKEPEKRYKSASDFSDDIDRYLRGLPVSATADSRGYRVRKFYGRHKAAVFTAGAFALLLLLSAGAFGWQFFRAQEAQARAEKRFNDVRKLAGSVVFELHDSIRNLPGATKTRELLVTRALEYLDVLAVESNGDPDLQMEVADALDKIGDVQGGYLQFHLAQHEKAKESYKKAFDIRKRLYDSDQKNLLYRHKLAQSFYKTGDMYFIELNVPEAIKAYGEAAKLYESPTPPNEDSVEIMVGYARALARHGYLQGATGDLKSFEKNSGKAIEVIENQLKRNPTNADIKMAAGRLYQDHGIILGDGSQNYEGGRQMAVKSRTLWKELFEQKPNDVHIKFNYAGTTYYLAVTLFDIYKTKHQQRALTESLTLAQEAQKLGEEIISFDPSNQEFPRMVSDAKSLQARILLADGRAVEGVPIMTEIVSYLRKVVKDVPDETIMKYNFGKALTLLGDVQKGAAESNAVTGEGKRKHWIDAKNSYTESLKIAEEIRKVSGNDVIPETEPGRLRALIAECEKAL